MANDAKTSSHIEAVSSVPACTSCCTVPFAQGWGAGTRDSSTSPVAQQAPQAVPYIHLPGGWGLVGVAAASVCLLPSIGSIHSHAASNVPSVSPRGLDKATSTLCAAAKHAGQPPLDGDRRDHHRPHM